MKPESDSRFSAEEILEMVAEEEDVALVKSWNKVFSDISFVSNSLRIPAAELSFSDEFGLDNKFFMRISVKDQKEEHEPELLSISIFSSPKKQKDNGLFIQMNSAQTSWENGRLNGLSITAQSFVPPNDRMPFSYMEVSKTANQMLDKVKKQLENPFSNKPQTDLMS